MKTLLLFLALSLPAQAQWFSKPDVPDVVMFGAAQLLIIADVAVTLNSVDTGAVEANPLYGGFNPSPKRIILTALAMDAGIVGIWLAVPPKLRPFLSGIIIGVEGYIVYRSYQVTMRF